MAGLYKYDKKYYSMIKLNIKNEQEFLKRLGSVNGGLAIAGSGAVNKGVTMVQKAYKQQIKKDLIVRRSYTLNAVQTQLSKPIRRDGTYRAMPKINASVGIRAMKGGWHYLLDQEFGKVRTSGDYDENKVGVPTTLTRVGKKQRGTLRTLYRKNRAKPRELMIGGKDIRSFSNPKQRFAIIASLARREPAMLRQPFYYRNTAETDSVMRLQGKKIVRERVLTNETRLRAWGGFAKSVKRLTNPILAKIFVSEAKRIIG